MVGIQRFRDILLATARQKLDAAQARRGAPVADEKPREAILDAIAIIEGELVADGYRLLKSGPTFKKDSGDLTCQIHFQSDRNNIAGRRAVVWIHAGVSSQRLKKWREAQTHPCLHRKGQFAGQVAGAQIGNLTPRVDWRDWDFVRKADRAAVALDAADAIRETIFPFFAAFEKTETVLPLVDHPMPWQASMLEYLLVTAGAEVAGSAGARYLAAHPLIKRQFDKRLIAFLRDGVPAYRGGDIGGDLAGFSVATGVRLSA
jgi:hypothetical protein